MVFNHKIPIKKSSSDIDSYLKNGPEFGNILFDLYEKILARKLKNATEVKNEYIRLVKNKFFKDSLVLPSEIFPFFNQKNAMGELLAKEICVSVNDCIAHGFYEDDFKDGDVISVDCGLTISTKDVKRNRKIPLNYDSAFTVALTKDQDWVLGPLEALRNIVKEDSKTIYDIGATIQKTAEDLKLDVVLSICGHGIGYNLHEAPYIYNGKTIKTETEELFDGLCFCAEPIFKERKDENEDLNDIKTYIDSDGWSIYTRDKKPTSHFETMYCVIDGKVIDITGITKWNI